ncbi:MAG: hypothetical protein LBD91_08425 [Prevotellaceae bacterium]|jgi:hypothetical protein|nr:hypothetical protein [Prevotellaceae bacterium]
MTNYLNKTSTVSWLVIALIVLVLISTFAIKRSFVSKATGETVVEETATSFFGKQLKKK